MIHPKFSFPAGASFLRGLIAVLLAVPFVCLGADQIPAPATPKLTNYTEQIPGTTVSFEMVAIPSGTLTKGDQKISIAPFWLEKYEVKWQEYILWVFGDKEQVEKEKLDGVTRPTKPYGSPYRERGEKGYPAIGMSNLSATEFCRWLSWKTGKKYRLPTEAEWEYACRAGSTTAYFWGDEASKAGDYGWFIDNSDNTTQPCGKKKPNAFGLYDIAGNVAEWVARPSKSEPAVARGGAFSEPVNKMRSTARMVETPEWNELDPQNPKSIWWLASADFAGFRVARSVEEEKAELKPAPAAK